MFTYGFDNEGNRKHIVKREGMSFCGAILVASADGRYYPVCPACTAMKERAVASPPPPKGSTDVG